MKMKRQISLFFVILATCTFFVSNTYAKWAYAFVVYNDNTYIISESHVEPNKIGKKIGDVTKYSDMEGIYSGNFSNQFPKGTEYFENKGVRTKEAIAIKENKTFIKADYDGKYVGSEHDHKDYIMQHLFAYLGVGVVLLIGFIYYLNKRKRK